MVIKIENQQVKKITVLFLLFIYLFSATDLKELLKINALANHFEETKQLDNSVSFLSFLVMHYITDDGNSKDNDTDKKLPFISHDVYSITSFLSIPNQFVSLVYTSFPTIRNDFFVEDDSLIFTNYHALVWHPPQFS